jgi:TolA-binding protein
MSSDIFDDDMFRAAMDAVRHDADALPEPVFARAKILASLHSRKRAKRARSWLALLAAAAFAGSTAWANPAVHTWLISKGDCSAPSQGTMSQSPPSTAIAIASSKDLEAPVAIELPGATPDATSLPKPMRKEARNETRKEARTETRSSRPSKQPSIQEADDAYRIAHRLHFVDNDFAAALVAWNDYMARAPSGRFLPEAKYNAAICLVRLHRDEEARRALLPIASQPLGEYRQREASALLAALRDGTVRSH